MSAKKNAPQGGNPGAKETLSRSERSAQNRRAQLRAQQIEDARKARNRKVFFIAAGVILALIVAIVATTLIQSAGKKPAEATGEQIVPPSATKEFTIRYNEPTPNVPSATVFLDFQCPACAQSEKTWVPMLKQLADQGKINLEFHMLHGLDVHFPGNHSQRAARAATCADTVGKYDPYATSIFDHQPQREGDGWTDDQLMTWAQQAGITGADFDTFSSCYTEAKTQKFVNDMQTNLPDYVVATPTLATNGQVVNLREEITELTPEAFYEAIKKHQ